MVWSSLAKILSTLSCRGHILFSRRRSASARAIFATLPTPRNATRVRCSFSESSSFSSSTSLPLQIVLAFQLRPLKNYCFWQFPEATITCPISALGLLLLQAPSTSLLIADLGTRCQRPGLPFSIFSPDAVLIFHRQAENSVVYQSYGAWSERLPLSHDPNQSELLSNQKVSHVLLHHLKRFICW